MGLFEDEPSIVAPAADGTSISAFRVLPQQAGASPTPILLVHGTGADHTTWRVSGPRLAATRTVYAMDRRGRGASGDTLPYSIEREFDDVAAVAAAIGPAVDVVGPSYGGRCALGASLLTPVIRRVVAYEGAPLPPGERYADAIAAEAVADAVERGDFEGAYESFLTAIVGLDGAALEAYRADPVWPARVAAAPTLVREMTSEASGAASLAALGAVRVPVLQVHGTTSPPSFARAVRALDAHLRSGRFVAIEGAAHAAHHTHPGILVRVIEDFLGDGSLATLAP